MSHAEEAPAAAPPGGAPRLRPLEPVEPRPGAAAPPPPAVTGSGSPVGPGGGRPARRGSGALAALREGVVVVVAALLLSLLVKTFLAQAFYIPSESMQQTLEPGDRVMVSLLHPGPFDLQRGDVVVFADPGSWLPPAIEPRRGPVLEAAVGVLEFVGILPQDSGGHLIKRVVGLPGDRVVCCDEQGRLSVNGEPLEEPYLYPGDAPSTGGGPDGDGTFDVRVPDDGLWVMGDHRSASQDSRFHIREDGGGAVPVDAVVGRAVLTVWPLPRWTWLSGYPDVFADVPAPSAASSAVEPADAVPAVPAAP